MPSLAVRDLRAGMVLKTAAVGPGGRVLAPAGQPLTDQHVEVLRAWGIETVELANAASRPAIDPKILMAAQRTVAARFHGQPTEHPAVRALFLAAVALQVKRGQP